MDVFSPRQANTRPLSVETLKELVLTAEERRELNLCSSRNEQIQALYRYRVRTEEIARIYKLSRQRVVQIARATLPEEPPGTRKFVKFWINGHAINFYMPDYLLEKLDAYRTAERPWRELSSYARKRKKKQITRTEAVREMIARLSDRPLTVNETLLDRLDHWCEENRIRSRPLAIKEIVRRATLATQQPPSRTAKW